MEIGTVIALIIALAAVIVGPVVSLAIAKRQIRAQLVSANRQKWIETLRNHIVNLLSSLEDLTRSSYYGKEDPDVLSSLVRADDTIGLLLKPNDELHASLHEALLDLSTWTTQCANEVSRDEKTPTQAFDAKTIAVKRKLVHDAAQAVLTAEQELIRRGE